MLWMFAWLAVASPEVVRVQVQVAADAPPGAAAGAMEPAPDPPTTPRRRTIYLVEPDNDFSDAIFDCSLPESRCRRDRRAWLFTVREHFMDEVTRLAPADLQPPRP